jgi:hypothetical protein
MLSPQTALRPLLLIVIILALTAVASGQSPYQTVFNNGDPRTRVDIVILGDGYTSAEMADYRSDVQASSASQTKEVIPATQLSHP